MTALSLLPMLFRQKAWANEDLFAAVASVDAAAQGEARHSAIRLLNHVYTVDQIFTGHLSGVPHGYTATNTPETPTLETLRANVRQSDQWLIDYAASATNELLSQAIAFVFTDGKPGTMTRAEMLHHLILHGSYHRGAVGRIVVQAGGPPLPDSVTSFLHRTQPSRRQGAIE